MYITYIWGQKHLGSEICKIQYIWGQIYLSQIDLGSNAFGVKYMGGQIQRTQPNFIEREGRDIAQQELQNATLASEGDNLFTMLPQLVMY